MRHAIIVVDVVARHDSARACIPLPATYATAHALAMAVIHHDAAARVMVQRRLRLFRQHGMIRGCAVIVRMMEVTGEVLLAAVAVAAVRLFFLDEAHSSRRRKRFRVEHAIVT